MKIKKFEVHGLHGSDEPLILNFNDDLNILSGRNGAGKTTILKLMWYLISGNFDKAVAEIKFKTAQLITDKYELTVYIDFDDKELPFSSTLRLVKPELLQIKGIEKDENLQKFVNESSTTNLGWFFTQYIDSSFFMPTFRMIEGGFTTEKYDIKHDVVKEFYLKLNNENEYNDIATSLNKLSKSLTKKEHQFITSISAKDIDTFLVKKYAEIMKKVNMLQTDSVHLLSKKISLMLGNKNELSDENITTLKSLSQKIQELDSEVSILNTPLNKIRTAVSNFMPLFNIEFDQNIYFSHKRDFPADFGLDHEPLSLHPDHLESDDEDQYFDFEQLEFDETENEKSSNLTINNLSAGEKQFLTFVAYNIFHNDTIFFIDEPELSLHVDWQNRLFSLLKEQNPSNQFIISTHSPFIYSLFPDKELIINVDKGCSEF